MALTRKFLVALGIEESKIDEIITAHTDVTSGLKKERDDYKEKAEQLEDVQKQLESANKELKKYSDDELWKDKYEKSESDKKKLQKDFDDYKTEVGNKETAAKKREAYKKMLKEAGISEKRIDSVMKVSDVNSIELDKDGKIKDFETLTENIKKEWADFIVTKVEHGVNPATPPANNGGVNNSASRASQLARQYHENLYGSTQKED